MKISHYKQYTLMYHNLKTILYTFLNSKNITQIVIVQFNKIRIETVGILILNTYYVYLPNKTIAILRIGATKHT